MWDISATASYFPDEGHTLETSEQVLDVGQMSPGIERFKRSICESKYSNLLASKSGIPAFTFPSGAAEKKISEPQTLDPKRVLSKTLQKHPMPLLTVKQKTATACRQISRDKFNIFALRRSRYYRYIMEHRITSNYQDAMVRSIAFVVGKDYPKLDDLLRTVQNYLQPRIKTIDASRVDYYLRQQSQSNQPPLVTSGSRQTKKPVYLQPTGLASIFSYSETTYIKETTKHQLLWKKYRGFVLPLKDYQLIIQHIFTIYAPGITRALDDHLLDGRLNAREIREILDDFFDWNEREMFPGRLIPLHIFLLWMKYTLLRIERVRKSTTSLKSPSFYGSCFIRITLCCEKGVF